MLFIYSYIVWYKGKGMSILKVVIKSNNEMKKISQKLVVNIIFFIYLFIYLFFFFQLHSIPFNTHGYSTL